MEELDHKLRRTHAYFFDGESSRGYIEEIIVSEFQADAYMAGQIINRTVVMTMTRYSDMPIITGDCCICIKIFNKGNYEIACTSEENFCKAMQFLSANTKAIFSKAVIPCSMMLLTLVCMQSLS